MLVKQVIETTTKKSVKKKWLVIFLTLHKNRPKPPYNLVHIKTFPRNVPSQICIKKACKKYRKFLIFSRSVQNTESTMENLHLT